MVYQKYGVNRSFLLTNKYQTLLPILISLISSLMYLNTLHHQFVFDDFRVIVNNPFIKDWKYFSMLFNSDYFRMSGELSYRPLVTLSYFIDYSLWHLNPLGFHLTNLLLHTFNVFFTYSFLLKITGERSFAGISSLFFGIHPILTETVNSVGFREDLVCTTFFLLTVFFYGKMYTAKYKHTCYALALLSYSFSLCSKEMAISLPLIIFVLDLLFSRSKCITVHPRQKSSLSKGEKPDSLPALSSVSERALKGENAELPPIIHLKAKIMRYYQGFLLLSGGYIILRLVFLRNPIEHVSYPGNSMATNFLTMTKVITSYVKLLFFPAILNPDYHVTLETSATSPSFLISVTLLICIVVITARLYSKQKEIIFSLLWTFITLIPVMNIIPIGNVMAERYLYLPSLGFCMLLGILIVKISTCRIRVYRVAVKPCLIAILTFYLVFTMRHNRVWTNERSLWLHTVNTTSCSFNAHNNLGKEYFEKGLIDRAIEEYTVALAKASEIPYAYATAHYNLGIAYDVKGMYDSSIEEYRNALRIEPKNSDVHNNLGIALFKNGQVDQAIEELQKAILLDPNNSTYHQNLAHLYSTINMSDKAQTGQDRANSSKPGENNEKPQR